ncbi:cbb3-type cytochrome oxidase assembly protein CcoS [Olivibacter sitiensis]|uniref:cbb3-type cytochrome oxidase assembly protein CcoS n=1 Tax=Olivibacter sitiensis TaxID=376470 RepID=UPI00040656B9|nr:cbb3-type cytochrome oxidase assembly protein CcoS [Olivibacter sitiensis]
MSAIYFLIACSIIVAVIFLAAFFWANKSGQYEDTYTPSVRILFDQDNLESNDDTEETTASKNSENKPHPVVNAKDQISD